MRPTLDGLNSGEWFRVAGALTALLLLGVLLWFAGRCIRGALRFLADQRRAERERRAAEAQRRHLSATPPGYLRERSRGLVSYTPTPWPENDNRNAG